jgi:hypothetical protein
MEHRGIELPLCMDIVRPEIQWTKVGVMPFGAHDVIIAR